MRDIRRGDRVGEGVRETKVGRMMEKNEKVYDGGKKTAACKSERRKEIIHVNKHVYPSVLLCGFSYFIPFASAR